MDDEAVRIAIIGNSGSGKSTLALWLASRTGAPTLDLDTVAWEPKKIAVARSPAETSDEVRRFCSEHSTWIIEGCYTRLINIALEYQPTLLFLDPGEERCLQHCRSRPWEPHKYSTKARQDAYLEGLLSWTSAYYRRNDDVSLRAHERCFESYAGPKERLRQPPVLQEAYAQVLASTA